MAKYKVKVIQTLAKVIAIEAESHAAAKDIAENKWLSPPPASVRGSAPRRGTNN